ncbi:MULTISPECIES: hypothetical protein [unclassified Microbacterium]|uniref:hypothetical protein n=1 Tax=unclassified Microbacterium TaxID=2609290 RepID=UPI00300FB231
MALHDFTGRKPRPAGASRSAATPPPVDLDEFMVVPPSHRDRVMKVSDYRAHLAQVVTSGEVVEVTNHGATAGFWVPVDRVADDASREEREQDAYSQMTLVIATLAAAMDPADMKAQLADLEALRDAEGAIG